MKFAGRRVATAMAGVAAAAGFLGAASTTAIASSGVPYTDQRAVGSIGFCNAANQPVTKGSISDNPFVSKAIDSTPAAAPYNGAGETATLFIYQPREGIEASEWHGEQFGASSRSSTPQHPTAILTAGDGPLSGPLSDYPPQWDGLMEFRIYLGAPNQPVYSQTYDATSIKISGNTWQVVDGASVSCGDGQSVSLEQTLASAFPQLTTSPSPASGTGAAKPKPGSTSGVSAQAGAGGATGAAATGARAAASAGATGPAGAGGSVSAPVSGAASSASVVAGGSSGKHGGASAILWIVLVVGVIGAGAVAVQWRRSKPLPRRTA
jgi:hypothetical protein